MKNSKHIFIQVNTDKLAAIYHNKGKITNADALRCALIYEQGAMAMGDPIKNFQIEINEKQDVYLAILPLYLFSRNKLYFTGFSNKENIEIPTEPKLSYKTAQLSFLLETRKINLKENLHFNLEMRMDYLNENGEIEQIPFTIDPVLKIKQD